MAQSIVERLKALEDQKNALLEGALNEIKASIHALNAAGYSYRLTDDTQESSAKPARKARADAGAIRWSTSAARLLRAAKENKATKAQALDTVKLGLDRLAAKKGVQVPADALADATAKVEAAYKK